MLTDSMLQYDISATTTTALLCWVYCVRGKFNNSQNRIMFDGEIWCDNNGYIAVGNLWKLIQNEFLNILG